MSFATHRDRCARAWVKHDGLFYAAFAVACTFFASSAFYGYLLTQTKGAWSAPLDDVFIHLDYARSFARGYAFQWTEGNGYSSGNTSLTYPIVLALGHWLGFRELLLLLWAAIIAHVGVFVFLQQSGNLVDGMARRLQPVGDREHAWLKYLIPPTVLSLGALNWTLWSGMENAWHLGLWGVCLAALCRQMSAATFQQARRRAWWVGCASALLVATRPESVLCAAAFGFFGLWHARRSGFVRSWRDACTMLLGAAMPPVALLVIQALVNKAFTGEYAASGAIAKLVFYQPFMSRGESWNFYVDMLRYLVTRFVEHHLTDAKPWGYIIPALALVPLASSRLRPIAVFLWFQLVTWVLLISVNMQARWQNERYAMPAAAWLLLLAAMGLGLLVAGPSRAQAERLHRIVGVWSRAWPVRALIGVGLAALYWRHEEPQMRDQIWFFGRASRNIFDQQLMAGYLLKRLGVDRVLVGDAGAILYGADRPGIDLIGLGGFHRYPFARAGVNGLGATLEQLERIPQAERPDTMAIYPSWWADLPSQFGHFITAIPVIGNVICGGAEKAIYRTDWSAFDREGMPRSLGNEEHVVDELDEADLTSEAEHEQKWPQGQVGFVKYRVLADPRFPRRDLFDAGRIVPLGGSVSAELAMPRSGGRLIVRMAPDTVVKFALRVAGAAPQVLSLEAKGGSWVEAAVPLPKGLPARARLAFDATEGAITVYHVWTVEHRAD